MSICPSFLHISKKVFSKTERKDLEFYPDCIPYDDPESTYLGEWERLAHDSKNRYLYVDGYKFKTVGRLRYAFEWVRGKFGFENHCNTARVNFALLKYSYYGYVNGYPNQLNKVLSQIRQAALPESMQFMNNAANIANLQTALINSYRNYAKELRPSFWSRLFHFGDTRIPQPNHKGFVFGDSLMQVVCSANDPNLVSNGSPFAEATLNLVLRLKPQDDSFIYKYLNDVVSVLQPEYAPIILEKNSNLAKAIAAKYFAIANEKLKGNNSGVISRMIKVGKKCLGQECDDRDWRSWERYSLIAITLDPSLEHLHLQKFVDYNIYKKQYEQAAQYIQRIPNIDLQYYLITKNSEHAKALTPHVKKDSPLAGRLAQELIKQTMGMFGTDPKLLIESIEKLVSWNFDPAFFFKYYVKHQQFQNAYKIYSETNDKSVFDTRSRQTLEEFYADNGEQLYTKGKALLGGDWSKTVSFYRESYIAKKSAKAINPANENYIRDVNIHRRLYAQTLFQQTLNKNNNNPNQCEQDLDKIIKKYEKCFAQDAQVYDEYLIPVYLNTLEARANLAINRCIDTTSTSNGLYASREHKLACAESVNIAIQCLKHGLKIMDKEKYKTQWAKFNFMLGHMMHFFEIDGYLDYLKEANDTLPSNPFYATFYTQMSGGAIDWNVFPEAGLDDADIYFKWKDNRWNKNKINDSGIIDIHKYGHEPEVSWAKMLFK